MNDGPGRLIDDRLLIEHLLVGLDLGDGALSTTSLWYFRACRAAALGAGGQLSGPFERLDATHRRRAIRSLLELPPSVGLPDLRMTVPLMADVAERHPKLNVMNLEAVAAAVGGGLRVSLSERAASGVLPQVFDAEDVPWSVVTL